MSPGPTDRRGPPPGSSLRPPPAGLELEGERILASLHRLEGYFKAEVSTLRQEHEETRAELDQRLKQVEVAVQANVVTNQTLAALERQLADTNHHMTTMLQRDVLHESRLGALELEAKTAGKAAGKAAGINSGAIASVIASVLFYLIQQFIAQTQAPAAQPAKGHSTPIATTPLP